MGRVTTVISWLMVTLGVVAAQAAQQAQRALPQWLTGIIAVAAFLFLVFVAFLVNRAWCDDSRKGAKVESVEVNDYATTNGATYDKSIDMVRSSDHENAYENLAADGAEDRVTVM